MRQSWWSQFRGIVVAVALSAPVWGGIGFIANDYFGFRSERSAAAWEQFTQMQQSAAEFDQLLRPLAELAVGAADVPKDASRVLAANALKLQREVQTVSNHVPEADAEGQALVEAIVRVVTASREMTGPEDAKGFVESVSAYFETRENFEKKVIKISDEYVGSKL